MPKGLLSRLIVRLHHYIADVEKEAWLSGVLLHRHGAKAKLKEEYGTKRLILRVNGSNAKELLTIIAEEVDRLNNTFTNLKVKKLVPCNCSGCRNDPDEQRFYEYKVLLRAREKGVQNMQCQNSFQDVNVAVN